MTKLSAVVITKNEEKRIERCLGSLENLSDEIIIVDDKSTDKTIELSKNIRNVKVIINESAGNFDRQRNIGIENSSGDWILQLDADEIIPPETSKRIRNAIAHPDGYVAFNLKRKNFFLGKPILHAGNYENKTKLFRRDVAKYVGCSVHETLEIRGMVGDIDAEVFHYPFNSIGEFIEKVNYYSEVEAKVYLKKNGPLPEKELKYLLTWKSVKSFYKTYIKKQGYKDGMHGLIWCLLNVINSQLRWMKIWEFSFSINKGHDNE